jgi:hypothetical protein
MSANGGSPPKGFQAALDKSRNEQQKFLLLSYTALDIHLDRALTFAKWAIDSVDIPASRRNHANAQRVYQGLPRRMERACLRKIDWDSLQPRLLLLESILAQLRETAA